MLIFIYGSDDYLLSRRKKSLIESARADNREIETWRADETKDPSVIISAAFNLSLFASKKSVFVDNLESASKKFLEAVVTSFCDTTEGFPIRTDDLDVVLILREGLTAADKNSVLYKKIFSTAGRIYEEKPLKGDALLGWTKKSAASFGKKITDDAALLLISESGGDMGVISSEIEKCALALGDGRDVIDVRVVTENLFEGGSGDIFEFASALERRNIQLALKELRLLLDSGGEEPLVALDRFQKVFGRIYRYFLYKDDKNISRRDLSIRLGLHPYFDRDFFYKIDSSGYTAKSSARALCDAASVNLRLKRLRTLLEKKIALETLVAQNSKR